MQPRHIAGLGTENFMKLFYFDLWTDYKVRTSNASDNVTKREERPCHIALNDFNLNI